MHKFFYGFEGLSLIPGNKTAGFDAFISTQVLQKLVNTQSDLQAYTQLMEMVHKRIANAKLLPTKVVTRAGIALVDRTMCPRVFTTDREFGGSLGAEPSEVERLQKTGALEWIGPSMAFTPHNVDAPNQALVLMVMVQTWAEWVQMYMPEDELFKE